MKKHRGCICTPAQSTHHANIVLFCVHATFSKGVAALCQLLKIRISLLMSLNADAGMRDRIATLTLMNAYEVRPNVHPAHLAATLLEVSPASASSGTQVRTPNLLLLRSISELKQ